jgi:hypothetical protein
MNPVELRELMKDAEVRGQYLASIRHRGKDVLLGDIEKLIEIMIDEAVEIEERKTENAILNQQLSAKTISQQNIINAFGIKGEGAHSKLVIEYVHGLVAENEKLKSALHPIANEHSDCECTDRPVWYVVNPRQMMSATASNVCSMFHGPFWSRERADEFLENTRYRYGDKASVYCKSLYHYPEMRALYDASAEIETPVTDAFTAELRAQGVSLAISHLSNKFTNLGVPITSLEWLEVEMRAGRKG